MQRLAAILAIVLLGLAAAPLAQAQIGPNVPSPLIEDPPPPPAAPQELDDGGLSGLQKLLVFGVAALVLGVIGYVIVRDARRRAPVDARPSGTAPSSESSATGSARSARERERQQRAKRAKAKAARRQRRRNR